MIFSKSLSLIAACILSLGSLASTAHADELNVIDGAMWQNQPGYPNSLNPVAPSMSSVNLVFTVNDIHFHSGSSNDYTLGGFLFSDPSANLAVSYFTPSAIPDSTLNDTTWEFTGSTYLTAGMEYIVRHDDGMYLFLNGGSCVICSGAPTSAKNSMFTVGESGNYSFELLYGEVNGAPAVLDAPFAATPAVPEPSSLVLLGSGLLGAAGVIRRRVAV